MEVYHTTKYQQNYFQTSIKWNIFLPQTSNASFHQPPGAPMNTRKNYTGLTLVAAVHLALGLYAATHNKVTIFRSPEVVVDLPQKELPPPPKVDYTELPMEPLVRPDIVVPPLPETVPLPQDPPPVTARPLPDGLPLDPPARGRINPDGGDQPLVAPKAPVHVAAVVDASHCTRPDYPAASLRNGESGVVMLAFLIGTDGKVVDSRVEKSSGSRSLDKAAQQGLGLCRFKPGTVDGVPQQSWTRMQYVWTLDE
jgi:protein TonB